MSKARRFERTIKYNADLIRKLIIFNSNEKLNKIA